MVHSRHSQLSQLSPVLALGIVIVTLWFLFFPLKMPFELQDVIIEGLILATASAALIFIIRFRNPVISAGLGVLVIGLLIDFLDEFTKEPDLINTQIEGGLEIAGLMIIVYGLYIAYKQFDDEIGIIREREDALSRSEQRYRNLVESISEVVCETDGSGNLTYVSPRMKDILGYEPDELREKPLTALIHEHSEEQRDISGAIETREPFSLFRCVLRHREDKPVSLEVNGTPILHQGEFIGYRLVCRDVTEKKRFEEALRLNNVKLNLLSNITRHDVLNQLTVIMGYIDLSRKQTDDPTLLGYIEKEYKASEAIHQLINFTKDYQDIGMNAPKWQNIQSVAIKAADTVDLANIHLKLELDKLEIFADPLLEKVFYTLFENTVRHGGEVTTLTVSSEARETGIVIVCADDGKGIAAVEKDRIFKREYGKNTGYGLFLASEILSITGMEIRECGVYGEGARFEILVPEDAYRSDTRISP